MKILAICGSLREKSNNKTLLKTAIQLVPEGMTLSLFEGIGSLPHFNPDLEEEGPSPVIVWQKALRESDGLLVSTPEYAHGIPGSLKNALDWVVGSGELVGKPVTLFDASTRSHYAKDSLVEVLKTMASLVVPEAFAEVPFEGKKLTVEDILADPRKAGAISRALKTFQQAIETNGRKPS